METRNKYKKALKEYVSSKEGYCEDCTRRINTNVLRILDCKEETCKKLNQNAPSIIDYLEEEDKKHFEEIIYYLDNSEMKNDYIIDEKIVRGLDYYNRTVFEIVDEKGKAILRRTEDMIV